jgi:hypothetical protein
MLSTSFLLVFRRQDYLGPELTNMAVHRIGWFFAKPGPANGGGTTSGAPYLSRGILV